MSQILNAFVAVLLFKLSIGAAPIDVLFLISSQDSSDYHRQLSASLRNDILHQTNKLSTDYTVRVCLLHEIFKSPGDWTMLTILSQLYDTQFTPSLIKNNTKWIVLCEESTHVAVRPLLNQLSKQNYSQPFYLGYPLYDHEATIIHHFAYFENPKWFPYPMLRAGIIFTAELLKSVAAAVAGQGVAGGAKPPTRTTEFSIDAAHELARFILDNVRIESDTRLEDAAIDFVGGKSGSTIEGQQRNNIEKTTTPRSAALATTIGKMKHFKNARKIILQRASYICPKAVAELTAAAAVTVTANRMHKANDTTACAMYAKPMDTTTCSTVKRDQIFVAIKTCQKFHKERITIIEATWAPYIIHKRYYSDVTDASIPTINVGIPNAETGHCMKTLAILKLALKDVEQMNREMLALQAATTTSATATAVTPNDQEHDTTNIRWILLSDDDTLLSVSHLCDLLGCYNHTDMIYLGERYGYRLHAEDGFNYITGGGGIIFSLPIVRLILKHCTCPTATSPDDMILGACLQALGIKAIHTPRFHQARPNDYPRALLQLEPPISFHKFWQLDPLQVYESWFATADREMLTLEILKQQSYRQRSQNRRIKVMASTNNKSRYTSDLIARCGKRREFNSVAARIDATKNLHIPVEPAFDEGTKSHLDL